MRVALVYIPSKGPEALLALAKAMARSLESTGHFVDIAEAQGGRVPSAYGLRLRNRRHRERDCS